MEELYEILKVTPIDKEALIKLFPILKKLDDMQFYNPAHKYGVLDHSLAATELADEPFLRLVLVFHDVGKLVTAKQEPHKTLKGQFVTKFPGHELESSKIAGKIFDGKLNKEMLEKMVKLIELHDTPLIKDNDETVMDDLIAKYGTKFVDGLLKVQRADMAAHEEKYANKMLLALAPIENRFTEKAGSLRETEQK